LLFTTALIGNLCEGRNGQFNRRTYEGKSLKDKMCQDISLSPKLVTQLPTGVVAVTLEDGCICTATTEDYAIWAKNLTSGEMLCIA
jgi:hypothetical protein